ncbi:hypothetical protein GP486_001516 [Trichoglossum hirsutum]|uniref:Uncharacterized protein n=1 Tax=Trichoglossum hirsutum TaxID=265104 RepID=A0A9P8RT16_9PEZI|nr:hypothetical protein GP486_001516 [Trichoglossum hirsutum]
MEPWILKMLLALLKKMDRDFLYRPSTKNAYLHKLMNIEGRFGEEDARNVIQEYLVLWPELEELRVGVGISTYCTAESREILRISGESTGKMARRPHDLFGGFHLHISNRLYENIDG